jgi:hypothetical protein
MAERRKDVQSPLTGLQFWLIAVGVVLTIGAAIWVAIPGPDTRHDLRSPSGRVLLQIAEDCDGSVCRRVVIHEAGGARHGCPVDIAGGEPAFVTVTASWSANESEVTLDYADGVGKRGELRFVPARDCTAD